jgi:hypothetical protein
MGWISYWLLCGCRWGCSCGGQLSAGQHHRVAAKVVSKMERRRPAASVHGFVLAVFRARARARSTVQLYHSILVNALLGQEFGNG